MSILDVLEQQYATIINHKLPSLYILISIDFYMPKQNFHRHNHYVPQGYLKRWVFSQENLWVYRLLVSHPQVPDWKKTSIKGAAYHSHLYTRLVAGQETDDFERWFDREFEAPAEEPLRKATSNARLTQSDWKHLIRFVAAQDVRTPARLIEVLQRCEENIPVLDNRLRELIYEIEQAHKSGETFQSTAREKIENVPLRVTTRIKPGQEFGELKVEAVMGRGLWLVTIQHLLTKTVTVLLQQKWTILSPPEGMYWLTSDDPVIRLNYYQPGKYDFKGGWGKPGSEILLPISPRHLLYTQIGTRPAHRGIIPRDQAEMIQHFIVEHAHRLIFASAPDPEVRRLRPRTINSDIFKDEMDQCDQWHQVQTATERALMGWNKYRNLVVASIQVFLNTGQKPAFCPMFARCQTLDRISPSVQCSKAADIRDAQALDFTGCKICRTTYPLRDYQQGKTDQAGCNSSVTPRRDTRLTRMFPASFSTCATS